MLGEEIEVKQDATCYQIDAKQNAIKQPRLFFAPNIPYREPDDEEEKQ